MRARASVVAALLSIAGAGVSVLAQAASDVPHWAYGYMQEPGPGESAPPCPADARPFPECAYPVKPVTDDGVKRQLAASTLLRVISWRAVDTDVRKTTDQTGVRLHRLQLGGRTSIQPLRTKATSPRPSVRKTEQATV